MRYVESIVWHSSLPLTNSFNKTEAAIFTKQAKLFLRLPLFSQINYQFFILNTVLLY